MRLVALLVLLSGTALFAAQLYPANFQEWLDDTAIEDSRPVKIGVTIPFDQVGPFTDVILKTDAKMALDAYTFRTQGLVLETTKAGVLSITGRLAEFGVTQLSAASDLGTFDASMSKIRRLQQDFEDGKVSLVDASKGIRAILGSEFNLRKALSKNDVIALGAGLLDKELSERPDDMVRKVRDGYATGLRFNNEIEVDSKDAPPGDTDSYTYVRLNSFPTASGGVTMYRKVAKVADAKEYILAAKLPKEYEYELASSTTVNSPMFVLKKK